MMISPSALTLAIAKRILQKREKPSQVPGPRMAAHAAALGYSATYADGKVVCTADNQKTSVSVDAVRKQAKSLARAAGDYAR
jgi:hypothetical protein